MYFMHKSVYVNVSWGQRAFYATIKLFIDPETRQKLVLSGDSNPKELLEMVHPSQLEKRFGGTAPTPSHFWPP